MTKEQLKEIYWWEIEEMSTNPFSVEYLLRIMQQVYQDGYDDGRKEYGNV